MIKTEMLTGLLKSYEIENSQDIAALKIFLKLVVVYQAEMGIEDKKLRKFLNVTENMIEML